MNEPQKISMVEMMLQGHASADAAVQALRSRVATDPVNARLDLQVLLNALGREEESFTVSSELFAIAPTDPRVLFNRGWHLLKRGQLLTGLQMLENGRSLNTYGHGPIGSVRREWNGGRGERVHLVLEGGLGDQIIHFRFARDLAEKFDCHVNVVCEPSLGGLFAHQKYVASVAQREACLGVYHDSWIQGMSAARVLGYEYDDLSGRPYLEARPAAIEKWRSLLSGGARKLRVGIRWAGNPRFEHQQLRRFPEDILLDLRSVAGVQLYSFQRDDGLIDLPADVIDLGPHLRDWDDTAAAISHMDLVISSCTSVAHAAAALGKPTWVLVPALPYFIWAPPGRKSLWYDSVTLFRQNLFGNWENVRTELREEFVKKVQGSFSTATKLYSDHPGLNSPRTP